MPKIVVSNATKRLIAFGFSEFEAPEGHTVYDITDEKLPDKPRFCKYEEGVISIDQAFKDQFLADESILKQLKNSDGDMIRVLEDIIGLLNSKGILSESELPQSAKDKLNNRQIFSPKSFTQKT